MDLEMTGLEPETDTILEIATLVTDSDLKILAEGPVITIKMPLLRLQNMDDWNREHHTKSGLWQRALTSPHSLEDAEDMTLRFLRDWTDRNKSPLCGNSITQDRRFLYKYMPKVSEQLHYRNIDVSSIKELYHRWYPKKPNFQKAKTHRAMDDILESIEEMRYYRNVLFVPGDGA